MLSNNYADQQVAREQLITMAKRSEASDSFLDALASSLNDELMSAKAGGKADLRCRLNVAIAVANVAAKASARVPNTQLEPITEELLKDKSQPVVLWAVKAAGAIIPSMLISGQSPKQLAQLVIDAVRQHSDCLECGAVVEEGYNSLTLNGPNAVRVPSAGLKNLIPFTIQLLSFRISQYQAAQAGNAGTPPPPLNPTADSIATNFFVKDATWSAMDDAQRSNTLKLMVDLVEQLVKQLPQAPAKDETIETIRRIGGGFSVVGQSIRNKPLDDAGAALNKIGNDPDGSTITPKIEAVKNAINGLGLPAPTINPAP